MPNQKRLLANSETDLANQKQILANQKRVLANQKRIEGQPVPSFVKFSCFVTTRRTILARLS